MAGRGDHNHSNRSYTIQLTKTGCIINRNSKNIKATLITGEQYIRDQLTQHTEDFLDKTLKHCKKLSIDNVPNNPNNRRRDKTYMNNKSDMQNSNTQNIW